MFVGKYILKRNINGKPSDHNELCNQVVSLLFPSYKIVEILKDFFSDTSA